MAEGEKRETEKTMTNSLALATTYQQLFLICDSPRQCRVAALLAAAVAWVWKAYRILDQVAVDLEEVGGELIGAGIVGIAPWWDLAGCIARAVWWGVT